MKILLIDGHALFCEGLHPILEQLSEVSRIPEAGSFAEGLELAKQRPNLVLLEIKAPGCESASSVLQNNGVGRGCFTHETRTA